MNSATTSSVDSAIAPSATKNLVALVALAILRDSHPEWTTASVATRASELSISEERISRLKAAVMPKFTEVVTAATRRGRRPFRWRPTIA